MAKQVIFDQEVRGALKRGVDIVAGAVRVTLGPRGRNVAIDKSWGGPTITNDGVSIAKEISLENKFENMGASIVKEVATKTNDKAGDGTTTAVVLTQAIVHEGLKRTALGANAMMVRRGIEKAAKDAVEELRKMAREVKGKSEIRQVASIAAESSELGEKIAEVVGKVGKDGVVTVEESQATGIDSEYVEGMEFDKGYVSAYMITNAERMEAEVKDASILITDKKISAIKDILPFLEKVAQAGKKDLVIVADETPLVILSAKTTLAERVMQTINWNRYKERLPDELRNIRLFLVTAWETFEPGSVNRERVQELDAVYVCNSQATLYGNIKRFSAIVEDLARLVPGA